MSLRLPTFQSGRPLLEQVTADKLNQLVDAIRQCELNSGVGYDVNKNSGGATLTIRQQGHQYVQGDSAKKIIGPANSGMSHTDAGAVVNPGVESYNFQCKTPTGSYTTAFVHGATRSSFLTYNTENNRGLVIAERKRTPVVGSNPLSANDLYRNIGLKYSFEGDVFNAVQNFVPIISECDAITSGEYATNQIGIGIRRIGTCGAASDIIGTNQSSLALWAAGSGASQRNCGGTTYYIVATCSGREATSYYTFTNQGSSPGNFGDDQDAVVPTGIFSFKRIFDLGSIPASSAKIRVKVRIAVGTFTSVKLNGQNATYSSFETQTSTFVPIEIIDGFISGQNELEITVTATSTTIYPSVSFEFLPTTATIESSTGFAALTDAQKDLIGNGTPVQVTVGTTNSIYAYDGSGDKGTTASYTFLRDV